MNAGPKQFLGSFDSGYGGAKLFVKFIDISGTAVGQVVIVFGPDELRRIKFRGVRWEPFHMEPETSGQKVFDFPALMDRPVIPEQDNGTSEVPASYGVSP